MAEYLNNPLVAEMLSREDTVLSTAPHFTIDEAEFNRTMEEAKQQHPEENPQEIYARTIYRCLTKPRAKPKTKYEESLRIVYPDAPIVKKINELSILVEERTTPMFPKWAVMLFAAIVLILLMVDISRGQNVNPAITVATCNGSALPAGQRTYLTMAQDGGLCIAPITVTASVGTAGLATSANQTNNSQKTQLVDSGGNAVTVTGNKLDVNATVSAGSNQTVDINLVRGQPAITNGTGVLAVAGATSAGLIVQGSTNGVAVQVNFMTAAPNVTIASGSVTANAGTNLNTSTLALESGGNLATLAGTVTSSRAAVNLISGQTGVAGNTGTVGATTQRMVLATDVALPAGTNVLGHVIADTGSTTAVTQATGTNLHAVVDSGTITTVSTVTTLSAAPGAGTTGSAVPAAAVYLGSQDASANLIGDIVCTLSKIYDASTSGNTELVALSGSKHVYICGYEVFAAGTVNVSLVAGTGTACASAASGATSTGTSGASAALTPAWQFTAQTGKLSAYPMHGWLIDAGSANALCLKTSAGIAVQAQVFYSQR